MPTDLPPDYKPKPATPGEGKRPGVVPPEPGEDVTGQRPAEPPRPEGPGLPGRPDGDVVNPPGWKQPPAGPDTDPLGVPTPAETPTF